MRDILFRGKRVENGEWVYGSLIKLRIGDFIVDEENTRPLVGCGEYDFNFKSTVVKSDSVSEFTGLIDKNDKKIFEGDIVIDKYDCERFGFVGVVEYVKGRSAFEIVNKKHPDYVVNLGSRINSVKVIGNIHDNPELLKGEE